MNLLLKIYLSTNYYFVWEVSMAGKQGKDLALSVLRVLPRVTLSNIRSNPGALQKNVRQSENLHILKIVTLTKIKIN